MKFLYVKVYLYLYPRLRAIEEELARSVELKAALSYRTRSDAFSLAENIADMLLLKERIIALRETLDEIVGTLSEGERELFEYKYLRKKGAAENPTFVACSERQYFRLQHLLLSKIKGMLIARGYFEEGYFAHFGSFPPFGRVYRALEEGREQGVTGKRSSRLLVFQNSSAGARRFPRRTNAAIAMSATPAPQITITCITEGEEDGAGSGAGSSADEGLR